MKIRTKSAFFFILCSVLPLFGVAIMAFDASRNSMRTLINSELVSIKILEAYAKKRDLDHAAETCGQIEDQFMKVRAVLANKCRRIA